MRYYLLYLLGMSLLAYLLYFADKCKAKKHKWRIRESVLLGVGLLGGSIGALAGMQLFRHKTKHWYFWAVNVLGLLLQLAVAVLLYKKGVAF